MRKAFIFFLTTFLFLISSATYAAGIYFKESNFSTELIFENAGGFLKGVDKKNEKLNLIFTRNLGAKSELTVKAKYFNRIITEKNLMEIFFDKDVDYVVVREGNNIKVVASKKKKNPDIKLGYGIEQPLIKKGTKIKENAEAERLIGLIDDNIAQKKYKTALFYTEKLMNEIDNKFYQQEGLFREGKIYYLMGETGNFGRAAELFDEFINKYPESYKLLEVMKLSAQSKANAELYHESIETYNKILNIVNDAEQIKDVMENLADLYAKIGQYKDAIQIRDEMSKKFKDIGPEQKVKIGVLKMKRNDKEGAYHEFLDVAKSDIDFRRLDAETIFLMAKVLEDNNQYLESNKAYQKLYTIYPSSEFSDLAMFRSGLTLEKLDRGEEADEELTKTINLYAGKKGSHLAALAYARKHLKEKTHAFWREYLSEALESPDFDISANAHAILIFALYNDKDIEEAEVQIERFMRDNFGTPLMQEVSNVAQRIELDKAHVNYKAQDFQQTMDIIDAMLQEWPDSVYLVEAKKLYQDALYKLTLSKFGTDDYQNAIKEIEDFYADESDIFDNTRWNALLDEAYYKQTKKLYDTKQYERVLVSTGQYFVNIKNGSFEGKIRELFEKSLTTIILNYFNQKDYIGMVRRFDEHLNMINSSKDQKFKDFAKSYAAFGYQRNGLQNKALSFIGEVKEKDLPMYILVDILMANRIGKNDINKLPVDKLELLAGELEDKNLDLALETVDTYTANKAEAMRIKYKVSKNIFNDLKRENVLLEIYNEIKANPKSAFNGSDDVYLSIGILHFNKNNFESAQKILGEYLLLHNQRDNKRAEGLYYLGKSNRKSGQDTKASGYFLELVETVPNSVYAGAAKKELEDIKWYESLGK